MSIAGLTSTEQTTVIETGFAANDLRALIANHLGISISRVTDEAHFTTDLGADWLDRLDLMMAVEDRFAGVEITDNDVDRIELVVDLIRHVETWDNERRRRGAAPVFHNLFGPHVARIVKSAKQQESCGEAALFFTARGRPDAAICVTIMQVRVQKIIVASPGLAPNNDAGWSHNDV